MVSEIIWIEAEKQLPTESEGTVLALMPNKFPHNQRIRMAKYSEFSKRWYYGDLNGVGGDDPIAWARLPIFE